MCDLNNAATAKNFYKGGTSGRDVPEFMQMQDKRIWIHGDPMNCKLCASCCPVCDKCCTLCLKCKTCECLDCPSCVKCNASCLKCKSCDCFDCPSCLKCNASCAKCKPSCMKCLSCEFCNCGPELNCRAVGCELCPGPLKICGDWHMSTDRCPDKCPAFLFPFLVNPDCMCKVPCCGGKNENFTGGDFVDPGVKDPKSTLKVKCCAGICNPACFPAAVYAPLMQALGGAPASSNDNSDKKADVAVAPKDNAMA